MADALQHGAEDGLRVLREVPQFAHAFGVHRRAVSEFYALARDIAGPACPIPGEPTGMQDLRRNVFSTFFLAVTRLVSRDDRYEPLYALVNQGIRAWVTACDNLLDDEYKEIFPFGFAARGPRMRSVLTLLLADRVVTRFVMAHYGDAEVLDKVGRVALAALLPSAIQECEEEVRPVPVLPSAQIRGDVHQRKTGALFAAPLALPFLLETPAADRVDAATRAVSTFGLACQVVDDVRDMPADVAGGRHNLVVSLVAEENGGNVTWLAELRRQPDQPWESWQRFPQAVGHAETIARDLFGQSCDALARLGVDLDPPQRTAIVALIHSLLGVPQEELR